MAQAVLKASLALNTNPFAKGLQSARRNANAFASSVGNSLKSVATSPLAALGGVIAGALAFKSFVGGIKGAVLAGDALYNMHRRTGLAVGSLAMLKAMSASAGVELDTAATAVARMQRFLFSAAKTGDKFNPTLEMLHLNLDAIQKMAPEKQFQEIGAAISKLPTATQRTGAAMAIFGRAGAELLPLFDELSHADFGALSDKAKVMEANAQRFHEITVQFRKAAANFKSVYLGIASKITEPLMAVAKLLTNSKFLSIGQKIGDSLRKGAEIFVGAFNDPGKFLSAFRDELVADMLDATSKFGDFVSKQLASVSEGFNTDFISTAATFTVKLAEAAVGFGMILEGVLIKAMASASAFVQATAEQTVSKGNIVKEQLKLDAMRAKQSFVASSWAPGHEARAKAMQKDIDAQVEVVANAFGNSNSVKARQAEIVAEGNAEEMGNAFIKKGGDAAAKAFTSNSFVSALAKGIATAGEKAEASRLHSSAASKTAALQKSGAASIAAVNAPPSVPNFGGAWPQWARTSPNMSKAFGQTPLLTVSERQAIEDKRVAAGGTRTASSSAAFNAIRSGDTARRKEVAREKLLHKEGIDRTNELLEEIKQDIAP